MIKNTKGLSMIVSVLLIIVLVLVATGIVWVVVRGVLQTGAGQFELSSKCLEVNMETTASCTEAADATLCDVTLNRKAGGDEITGVKLVFTDDIAGTNHINDTSGDITELGRKTVSAIATELSNVSKLDVVVYFTDESGEEQLCPEPAVTRTF